MRLAVGVAEPKASLACGEKVAARRIADFS